ncbi:unnamed protein product, partial [Musa textilis]
ASEIRRVTEPLSTSSGSSFTVAFSSNVSSRPRTLCFPRIRCSRIASSIRVNPPFAIVASSSFAAAAAVVGGAAVSGDDFEGLSLKKYVKARLPGGFAAQRIIGTGRR